MIKSLTEKYLKRPVDKRMVKIIDEYLPKDGTLLDLGCGSGLYGRYLRSKSRKVIGLDNDKELCKKAKSTHQYDHLLCDDVLNLEKLLSNIDGIFCSELLEHIDNKSIMSVLRQMEAICGFNGKRVITVPNPLSPHFKLDFSHVLKYNIFSFLRILNRSDHFQYKMYPIGFSEHNLKFRKYRVLNLLSKRVAILSPTVLYVGEMLKSRQQTSLEKSFSPNGQKKESVLVSVIIPTKNVEGFFGACLEAIKKQTYRNVEIVVVDDNSTDNTKKLAGKFTDKVFNYDAGTKESDMRSAQRNFGAKKAEGNFVLIIDSDMELSENVVEGCIRKANEEVSGVIIPEESFGEGFWARCKKLERSFYVGVDWMEGARFFRKEDFLKIGGYNESLISGEDWDLSQRMEKLGKLERVSNIIYHNEGRISLYKTIRKKYYYAQHFTAYMSINEDKEKIGKQTGITTRYKLFFSDPIKLFKNPIVGLGMLFMKSCEFFFFGVGLMVKRLNSKK